MFERNDHLIEGGWVPAAGTELIEVVSPSTEEVVGRVPAATEAEVDRAVAAARAAFDDGSWPQLSVAERGEQLRRFVTSLEARRDDILQLQIDETGATYKFAVENYNNIRPSLERMIADASQIGTARYATGSSGASSYCVSRSGSWPA